MTYCPREMAKQIDFDECTTLVDMYDPMHQVVLIVACVISLRSGDTVFKGRIISADSNQLISHIVDCNGEVVQGRIFEIPEDAENRNVLYSPRCNFCGKIEEHNNWMLKCEACKSFRYCSKKCQESDRGNHNEVCQYAKALREDAVAFDESEPKHCLAQHVSKVAQNFDDRA